MAADQVRDALPAAVDALAAAGVDAPRLDAELMLAEATGISREQLIAAPEAPLPPGSGQRFGLMVRRRLRREPLAYILGRKWFRHLELAVDSDVLIPRPETELLVEVALELRPRRVLEVGTGSGAVAVALAAESDAVEIVATDSSAPALRVALANAARAGVQERVSFLHADSPPGGRYDLLLANLPYVAESEWQGLAPEVREWEPPGALLAGADGLDAIRALMADLDGQRSEAAKAEAIALEVGAGQAAAVTELMQGAGYPRVEARRDLAGIDRVIVGRR
jgi:release factor glutamine methyltransferase